MTLRKALRPLCLLSVLMLAVSICFAQKDENQPKKSAPSPSKLNKYRSRDSRSSQDLKKASGKVADDDAEGALDEVQEALAESIAQGNVFNEGRSYTLLGDINANISEWKLAVQNYEKAYNVLKPAYGTSDEFKLALQGLAKANMESGNYQVAVDNYTEVLSLKVSESERRRAELELAEVYYRMGNYEESLKIAGTIPQGRSVSGDPELQSQYQNLMAKNYARKNDFDKTRGYLDSSRNTLRLSGGGNAAPTQNAIVQMESAKEDVAGALREQKRYEEEITLRNQSIEFNLDNNNLAEATKDKLELSKTLEAKGDRSEALKELIEAAAIADTIDDPHDQASAYLSLAGLYERNGQNNNALNAYRKYSEAVQRSEAQLTVKMEERARIIRKQSDIEELSKELYVDRSEDNAQKAMIQRQWFVIASLGVIILVIGVMSIFVFRSAQSRQKANQLLALKSLRSQMNPHFIFNALNSVNHFIAQQDERTANRFLSEFSQLMRLVLEYSQEDFITLQKEQEILTLYMKLEHYRFRDKFEYEIDIDESINAESISVPPMLIQPYLENAVWHGLRYRDTVGFLKLSMTQRDSRLLVTITDNGIGRKKSAELKTENQKKHRSTGLKNIKERLTILNTVYSTHYDVKVSDGPDGEGTVVEISLPVTNSNNHG
ncbi:MAG TPA: histidine kinase [Cyclobacteriaceae bacterium]|nr:histidine kinase [Cyclobacteriaceae bacterium]